VLTGESGPHTLTPCLARGPGEPPDDQARPVNRRSWCLSRASPACCAEPSVPGYRDFSITMGIVRVVPF